MIAWSSDFEHSKAQRRSIADERENSPERVGVVISMMVASRSIIVAVSANTRAKSCVCSGESSWQRGSSPSPSATRSRAGISIETPIRVPAESISRITEGLNTAHISSSRMAASWANVTAKGVGSLTGFVEPPPGSALPRTTPLRSIWNVRPARTVANIGWEYEVSSRFEGSGGDCRLGTSSVS